MLESTGAELAALPWFSSLGAPPTDAEAADARAYLTGLGAGVEELRWVTDWAEAEQVVRDPGGADWLSSEAALLEELMASLGPMAGEASFAGLLNVTVHRVSDTVMGAAALAAARDGVAGEAVIRVAAGAAGQTAEQVAVARLAGAGPDHPFEAKLRLYAGGRWPLGLVGGKLLIF